MSKASPAQTNFSGGQISRLLSGRTDLDRYKTCVAATLNWLPTVQGGATRRPGTFFVAKAKYATKVTRLLRFEFNNVQAYVLEFGDQYIRFYRNQSQILSGGIPYEISTPYLEADLAALKYIQSADTMILFHPSYPVKLLTRTSHTAWTLTNLTFVDGPYLPRNETSTTLTASAVTGSVTITASSIVGINGGTGFQTTDIGRFISHISGAVRSWLQITARASTTSVTALVKGVNLGGTGAITNWALGAYSATDGYPSCGCFHDLRLWLSGSAAAGQQIDGSQPDDLGNFEAASSAGVVTDSSAVSIGIDSEDVNIVKNLLSTEKGLLALTTGGEHLVTGATSDSAILPTSVKSRPQSAYGCSDIQAIKVGDAVLYIQRQGRKLREARFNFYTEGYRSSDLTVLAEDITQSGVRDIAYQKEKQPIVWLVLNNGKTAALVYEREDETLRAGWSLHQFGGQSTSAGAAPTAQSVTAVPSVFSPYTETWFVVYRQIGGASAQTIEFLTDIWEEGFERDTAFFVDCGLQRSDTVAISAIGLGNPISITTATAHGLTTGNDISIDSVVGASELNHNVYTVTVVDATHITIGVSGLTGYGVYSSGGRLVKRVTLFTGLTYLDSATVAMLIDSAAQMDIAVSAIGEINLDQKAGFVSVGFPYDSKLKLLRFDAGSVLGSSQGKVKFTNKVALLVDQTTPEACVYVGIDALDKNLNVRTDSLFPAYPAVPPETEGTALFGPDLFDGFLIAETEMEFTLDSQVCIVVSKPYAATILIAKPEQKTEDAI